MSAPRRRPQQGPAITTRRLTVDEVIVAGYHPDQIVSISRFLSAVCADANHAACLSAPFVSGSGSHFTIAECSCACHQEGGS